MHTVKTKQLQNAVLFFPGRYIPWKARRLELFWLTCSLWWSQLADELSYQRGENFAFLWSTLLFQSNSWPIFHARSKKTLKDISKIQSIIWYWMLWKVTSHSDCLPLIDILISRDSRFHHSDILSMFELSLELCRRSLSYVLRIRQEVHLHKARHFWPIPFCSRDSCGAYQLALIQSDHAGQVQSKCNLKNICICNRLPIYKSILERVFFKQVFIIWLTHLGSWFWVLDIK